MLVKLYENQRWKRQIHHGGRGQCYVDKEEQRFICLECLTGLAGEKSKQLKNEKPYRNNRVYSSGIDRRPKVSGCDLCLPAHHLYAQRHWEPKHYHPYPAGFPPADPHVFLPQKFLHIRNFIHKYQYTQVSG
ncbi:hypothetical protein H8959_015073 [Pygathrix nigripes]